MNAIIMTQARIGSSRFPRKVLETIHGKTLLAIHLDRLKKSRLASKIVVATTFEPDVSEIINIAQSAGAEYFQGDLTNVLDRFYQAAKSFKPTHVIRVTSDCPLIDASLIDQMLEIAVLENADYLTNGFNPGFPDGQDIEVMRWSALELAWQNATLLSEKEHVTPYIRNNSNVMGGTLFSAIEFLPEGNYGEVRMTVDEVSDKKAIELLIEKLGDDASWKAYADFVLNNPAMFMNQDIIRNEGYLKSLKNDNEN
jgi:spore coat polysaccharide biosynthesis protein SpsF